MPLKLASNIDLDKVIRNLGRKHILVPHIDMALGDGDFEWNFDYSPKVGDDGWHPSGDCTPSLYDLYQKAVNPKPEQISGGLRKIFMVGHFFHAYLQWVVEKRLGFCGPEDIERRGKKVWGDRPYEWATGSADICPCVIPGEGQFLIDFKTMNPRMFQYIPADYLAKWECQGNIYLDWHNLERAIFVTIDKSNGDMNEVIFERNQPLIDSLYEKWKLVGTCVNEGIEPPQDEDWPLPLQGPVS